jgi:Ca-activated chloride channel family protein
MVRFAMAGWMLLAACFLAPAVSAQAPPGPILPKPGAPVQPAPANQPAAQIKARVIEVNTPVTVRDSTGKMLLDLQENDFRILDNGAEQKITHFDMGGDPLSVVILLESSSRIGPLLPHLRKTGILFTQQVLGPGGEAAVVSFDDSISKLLDFSRDTDHIEKTVSQLKEGSSGLRLYDALAAGVEMLTGRGEGVAVGPGAHPRRRVVVVVSEATDAGSHAKLGEVLRQAQLASVTIYSVGLSTTRAELQAEPKSTTPQISPPGTFPLPPIPGTPQTPDTEAARMGNIDLLALAIWVVKHAENQVKDHALDVATIATGGMHLSTFRDRSIEKAIDEIGGELHAQYSLSYSPSKPGDYGYHEIEVKVKRPKLTVRARPGYYLAEPES